MTPSEIRGEIMHLAQQRLRAECKVLGTDSRSPADDEDQVLSDRGRIVLAAITELAVLYGQLYGPNLG